MIVFAIGNFKGDANISNQALQTMKREEVFGGQLRGMRPKSQAAKPFARQELNKSPDKIGRNLNERNPVAVANCLQGIHTLVHRECLPVWRRIAPRRTGSASKGIKYSKGLHSNPSQACNLSNHSEYGICLTG
jgi:hypothetical protein